MILEKGKVETLKTAISAAVDRAHSMGYKDGKDDGYKDGYTEGTTSNDEEVFEEGYNKGYSEGSQVTDEALLEKYDEGYSEGYEVGKASMIDPSKIIEKTATGTGIVALDDVSELPHEITVQLSGENVSGKDVNVYGKNLFANNIDEIKEISFISETGTLSSYCGYEVYLPNGIYTIRTTIKDGETGMYYIYGCVVDKDNNRIQKVNSFVESNDNAGTKSITFEIKDGCVFKVYNATTNSTVAATQKTFKKFDIQIELGYVATEFESFTPNSNTYTANADGKVEGIKGISPNMTFACNDADISVTYRKSWGIDTAQRRQWDAITDSGKRTSYSYAFANGYSNSTFTPFTDFVPTWLPYAFNSSKITDLVGCFKKYGTKLDTSKATSMTWCFAQSEIRTIPEISLVSITIVDNIKNLFYNSKVQTMEKLIFKDDGTTPIASNMFAGASNLKEIRVGGVIGQDINLSACAKLDVMSALNIFNHLKICYNDEDAFTRTIYLHSDTWEALFQYWMTEYECDRETAEYEILYGCVASYGWNYV